MINRLIQWLSRRRLRTILSTIEWTPEDEAATAHFFSTISGKKLIFVLQKLSIQRNGAAVMNGTSHVCGQAVGYALVLQDIHALSGAAPHSSYIEEPADQGHADNFEHLHP